MRQSGPTVHCGVRGTLLISVASLVEGGQASVAMAHGLSSWGSWAQSLWYTGLVAPQHVGSSWIKD